MDGLPGYRGPSLRRLRRASVQVGDVVELQLDGQTVRGTLVPRYLYDDELHIVVKLKNGYNVSFREERVSKIVKVATGEKPAFSSPPPAPPRDDLPVVSILGTGGTIASRVDYRTGAVRPAISAEELYSLIPELSSVARIRPEVVTSVYSENLEPDHWGTIAEKVAREVSSGVSGVVITTGTDVMGYTGAALSFALPGVPVPVLVVGSQRSSDRPSSDAYLNLVGAVSLAASADFSGVYVVMHADASDETIAVHRATRVRKNHTSARAAFRSVGVGPVAYWTREGAKQRHPGLPPRGAAEGFRAKASFEPNVALVKFYPSMQTRYLESILTSGVKGLVVEGSGLGHVNSKNVEVLAKFIAKGHPVCMASQCIWGRVDMKVYDTGRDLLHAGVVPLGDMLGETALVKMMWALANASSRGEAEELMRTDLAGETTERTLGEEGP